MKFSARFIGDGSHVFREKIQMGMQKMEFRGHVALHSTA
jgi:hypothetical protein